MYCSQRHCFNEAIPDAENDFYLCLMHYEEYKKKATPLDYSKLQTLSKDQKKQKKKKKQ